MLFSLLVLLVGLASAEPLEVRSLFYEEAQSSRSCPLLIHRHMERLKLIRESREILNWSVGDGTTPYRLRNEFLINQYFMEKRHWNDETTKVELVLEVTTELAEDIAAYGLDNVIFSVIGTGIDWQARAFNFPNQSQWEYDEHGGVIVFTYWVYQVEKCFGEIALPRVSWLSGHPDTLFDDTSDLL